MKRTQIRSSRRNTGPDTRTRALVIERACGMCDWCEMALDEWECHHRQLRSRGGGHGAENLVALHSDCHAYIHAWPSLATVNGFMVSQYRKPAMEPLRRRDGPPVWLLPDGTTSPTCPQGETQ